MKNKQTNKAYLRQFKPFNLSFILLIISVSILYSCNKDIKKTTLCNTNYQNNNRTVFDIRENSNPNSRTGYETKTTLGILRKNPFTTTLMAQAHNILYNTNYTEMPTTNKYIKFTPTTNEETKAILSSDIILYDYDLRYEVIKMGDYFQEPMENGFPTFYAVVAVDEEIPNVSHEIIDNLYLDQSNPLLIAEAYLLTDNLSDINNLSGFTLDEIGDINIEYIVNNTDELDCNPPCVIEYRTIIVNEDGFNRVVFEAYCDCEIPSTEGCSPTGDVRKPYGKIRVFDTQLSNASDTDTYKGVADIKVIIKDNWFNSFSVQTANNGCYKFDREFWGRIWISFEFKGSKCSIRGKKPRWYNTLSYFYPIKKYTGFATHRNYSNLITNIHNWQTKGSLTHLVWGAATTNNALNEYHAYAIQEGINPPPNNLDIFVWPNGKKTGFTLMASKLGAANTAMALTGATSASYIATPFDLIALVALYSVIPDVMISIDFDKSDKLKHLVNHEISHASHFTVVDDNYWMTLIAAEIKADEVSENPHGNISSWEAGRIALCESWAEHIGMSFTHKTYGNDPYFSFYPNYHEFLEHRKNESSNHIPIGYFHDLIDGINTNEVAGDGYWGNSNTTIINDNISGLTNQQLFSLFDNTVTSPTIFTTRLINSGYINGTNTTTDINNLFNSY